MKKDKNKLYTQPQISVVMPAYNSELYIDEAVNSILKQTFADFELIIINDGSTDSTFEKIEKWKRKDSRVKVVHQENIGRSLSRNKGLDMAQADYVAFADADDISTPKRLELTYNYLKKNPDVCAVSGIFDRICMRGVFLYKALVVFEHKDIEMKLLNDIGDQFHQSCSMVRKEIAIKVGGYNPAHILGDDVGFFLKMARAGKLHNLNATLLRYRLHPTSIVAKANKEMIVNVKEKLRPEWEERGLKFPNDFSHWLETAEKKSPEQDLLRWGWNALQRNERKIARVYAKELFFSNPLNTRNLRFICCAIRGR